MMNKIISKINILVLIAFVLVVPNFASALVFSSETQNATSITSTQAKLNGTVSFDGGVGSVWFEYGKSNNLDKKTDIIEVGSGNSKSVSAFINIDSNSIYYYRICFRTSATYGLSCGQVVSFNNNPVVPVVTNSTTTTNSTNTSTTNSSSNSNSNSASSSVKNDTKKDDSKSNSQSASVVNATEGSNFLPNTFLEWILVIALIFIIVMFGRYLYLKRQAEIEEEEKRRKEELIRAQLV